MSSSKQNSTENEFNPFQIPIHDADIIRIRVEGKRKRAKARQTNRQLKIWEKGKFLGQTIEEYNRAVSALNEISVDNVNDNDKVGQQALLDESNKMRNVKTNHKELGQMLELSPPYRIAKKEDLASFIAKKREMFLLQMSLNIKREEIRKIEERARLKEEALKRSELMLEDDGVRFDAFLKENDKKAQDAIRKAEMEAKSKMDKVQEIKKINHTIQAVQANISKHFEALEECHKYKQFLDHLSPSEWIEQQKRKKRHRQENRRKDRIRARTENWRMDCEMKLAQAWKIEEEKKNTYSDTRKKKRVPRRSKSKHINKIDASTEPDFEDDEVLTSSGDELPMYFKKPQQLLDIFAGLEKENLFLIENKQESEQELEELNLKMEQTETKFKKKTHVLLRNISQLKEDIKKEELKAELLKQRINNKSNEEYCNSKIVGSDMNSKGVVENCKFNMKVGMFIKLGEKVKEVYLRCGFDDSGTTPTTLFMLSELEARMEKLLVNIYEIPHKVLRKEMKDKEKKRREEKRVLKLEAQQKAQEERNRKALERSMQPPKKRTTKPVMFRSRLVQQKKKQFKNEVTEEELDNIKYLT